MNWIRELKPGDRVIIKTVRFCSVSYKLRKVEKITPKGYIKIDGILFCADGMSRGNHSSFLLNWSDPENQQKLKEYQEYAYRQSVLYKLNSMKMSNFTYEQAKQFDALLKRMDD